MKITKKLTLDQLATYEIKVPGILDENRLDWNGGMVIRTDGEQAGAQITTMTITTDQAALQGLLRHLYSIGLPLISAIWVDCT